ncbi:MAG: hypothetical protein ACK5XN_33355 [Bacteroidota bacterium]
MIKINRSEIISDNGYNEKVEHETSKKKLAKEFFFYFLIFSGGSILYTSYGTFLEKMLYPLKESYPNEFFALIHSLQNVLLISGFFAFSNYIMRKSTYVQKPPITRESELTLLTYRTFIFLSVFVSLLYWVSSKN